MKPSLLKSELSSTIAFNEKKWPILLRIRFCVKKLKIVESNVEIFCIYVEKMMEKAVCKKSIKKIFSFFNEEIADVKKHKFVIELISKLHYKYKSQK